MFLIDSCNCILQPALRVSLPETRFTVYCRRVVSDLNINFRFLFRLLSVVASALAIYIFGRFKSIYIYMYIYTYIYIYIYTYIYIYIWNSCCKSSQYRTRPNRSFEMMKIILRKNDEFWSSNIFQYGIHNGARKVAGIPRDRPGIF